MKLDEYLFWKNISMADFANTIGVCRQHILAIAKEGKVPRKPIATLIEIHTKGYVTTEDIYNPQNAVSVFEGIEKKKKRKRKDKKEKIPKNKKEIIPKEKNARS